MWLSAPRADHEVLWEGPLCPESLADSGTKSVFGPGVDQTRGNDGAITGPLASLLDRSPRISIGKPEIWRLADAFPPDKIDSLLRAKLDEADFYLVRLVCSFSPGDDSLKVARAVFQVSFVRDPAGRQPSAFDVHPLLITEATKRNTKVSLTPSFKFKEGEVKPGGVEWGFEYTELEPMITASNVGEPRPEWTYQPTRGAQIRGSKLMHVLVRAEKGMRQGEADLRFEAYLEGQPIPWIPFLRQRRETRADPMRVRLWG